MVRWLKTYGMFVAMIVVSFSGWSQRHLWTEVQVKPSYVYIGQPVEVTVSVFTSTWFTQGVHVQNIQVNDAFTVYFRSLSTSKVIKGKTYAGVQFFYNVFPYSDEDIVFPALEIEVETPDAGDYKGVKRKVRTTPRKIRIKPIPPGIQSEDWLVTHQMTVRDYWSGDLKNVKVGDVIERSIYREAAGTVSELIPPIVWDSLDGVSLYPDRMSAQNHKSKTAISAERTDRMRYLFEKEGEVVFPEMEVMWWNPRYKKIYKRTLKEVVVYVNPNPDLGMLESIKDSLNIAQAQAREDEIADKEFSFWGLTIKEWSVLILALIVGGYVLKKWIWPLIMWARGKYLKYRVSERYYFNQFLVRKWSGNSDHWKTALYRWIDELEVIEPSVKYLIETYGNPDKSIETYGIQDWLRLRKRYLRRNQKSTHSNWMNPTG
ncbi:BatD family protein [bacterium SCSIO 12643]|nr:BatD family protein [bacterium SCSIO 12643]